MSGFDDATFANSGNSITFAPNTKDKSLSRQNVIEESMVCKFGEVRCGENDEKYCGGSISRKTKKCASVNAVRSWTILNPKPIGAVRELFHHRELSFLR